MIIDRDVAKFIRNANRDEVNTIINLIKERQREITRQESRKFTVGDRVSFDAKTRGVITGEITKVNRKTVKVKADGVGFMWVVSPSLLKKVS